MPYAHASGFPPRCPSLSVGVLGPLGPEENKRRFFHSADAGEGQALALRCRTPFFFVSRGPVPRDRWIARMLARDRPSPYGAARRFFSYRGGLSPAIVGLRGCWRGTGPRPTVSRAVFFRSAGACPPRSLDCACTHDGEGNPLACACGTLRGPPPYVTTLF